MKLLKLGVSPVLVQWVADFLMNRKQRVKYKNVYSDWIGLTGGVPQGTIIGPVSFLCMINDALSVSQHSANIPSVWKYVDDLTIGENRPVGTTSTMQESLIALQEWAGQNKLKLNPTKCQGMQIYFGKKEVPDIDLRISDHRLEVVRKVKLLGVIIQDDLKWDAQIESIQTKANRKMFMLRKLKEAGFNSQELLSVYKSYIRPVLEYAVPLWHAGLTQWQSNRIEMIQKRVCKYILGREYISYVDSLAELEIDHLQIRREHICREFATKACTSLQFAKWFPSAEYISSMTLRKQPRFKPYRCNTKRFRMSSLPYMTDLLNNN